MKYTVANKLTDKGFPSHSKKYPEAHEKANKAEKAKFPKGYAKLKKAERKLSPHELMGKNTKSGKLEVEKRFKRNAKEIAYHESVENKVLRKKKITRK